MNFFETIMFPFTYVIREIFLFSYKLTDNYGIAIILLSLAISLLLLPVFIYIEKAKKKDDVIKQKMKPLIDEIKRVYKGQERYYYIKTINRQHNYSSLKALIPILSLLLQIPFFIAAYQFLEHYEPLKEVSFLFIRDLSLPDAVLGKIHILPIIMTLVNLITVYFYTINGDGSERKQMLVLAGAFLILLFNLPSALVLYWTMNNVFSFFRLFITNPEVFKKRAKQKKQRKMIPTIEAKPILFFLLFFFTIYFYFSGIYYYSGINKDLLLFSVIALILLQFIGYLAFDNKSSTLGKKADNSIKAILYLLLLLQLFFGISFLLHKFFSIELTQISFLVRLSSFSGFILLGLLFSLITAYYYFQSKPIRLPSLEEDAKFVYILVVLYFLGFIFLWNPLSIYSSYPANFEFPAIDILKNNFLLFFLSSIGFLVLFFLLPKKAKAIWFILFITITIVGFVHNTLLPIDVGSLQESRFVKHTNIAQPLLHYILEGLFIFLTFLFVQWIIRSKKMKFILFSYIILNVILIVSSFKEALGTGVFFRKKVVKTEHSISFSKDKKNIVFLIMDMFHGWHIDKIMKEEPSLADIFDGFVWYSNTVSVASNTSSSIGALLGGYDYTPDKMNQDKNHNLREKLTAISKEFYKNVKDRDYSFTANKMIYSKIEKNSFDTFLPKWHTDWNRWNEKLKIGMDKETGYALLWQNALFYSVPIFLKPKVYNQGKWFQGDNPRRENTSEAKPYNFLKLLPYISDTNNTKASFIFLHNMASHHPWNTMDEDGILHTDASPYQNNKWTIKTLAKWLQWMKEENVYDNTKIIILSDHGPHWGFYKGKEKDVPMKLNPSLKINHYSLEGSFPLLLVKDFGKRGRLTVDKRIMNNADASYIAFDQDDPTKVMPPLDRHLPVSIVKWHRKIWLEKQFEILYHFEVSDNVYDLKNWKRI